MIRINVASRHNLAVVGAKKDLRIPRPLPAHADHAKIDTVIG
jgi:hypothetical protein